MDRHQPELTLKKELKLELSLDLRLNVTSVVVKAHFFTMSNVDVPLGHAPDRATAARLVMYYLKFSGLICLKHAP